MVGNTLSGARVKKSPVNQPGISATALPTRLQKLPVNLCSSRVVTSSTPIPFQREDDPGRSPRTALSGRKDGSVTKAGVEFIDENGGGPGVRLRKPGKEKPRK